MDKYIQEWIVGGELPFRVLFPLSGDKTIPCGWFGTRKEAEGFVKLLLERDNGET